MPATITTEQVTMEATALEQAVTAARAQGYSAAQVAPLVAAIRELHRLVGIVGGTGPVGPGLEDIVLARIADARSALEALSREQPAGTLEAGPAPAGPVQAGLGPLGIILGLLMFFGRGRRSNPRRRFRPVRINP